MRIIAGEFRGRKLLAPEGDQTRPVTDRVKQSVFDILMPRLPDAIVYDCFAGTGSFGLESLSRGAKHATFFEAHRPTADRLMKNIATLRIENSSRVIREDIFAAMSREPLERADVIFLDPPYRFLRERAEELVKLAALIEQKHLAMGGMVVFRHDAADSLDLPALPVVDARRYGSMTVRLLGRPST
jgi:16S rRNA (guanine(966)-N(2))-methyltransferase RsmD